MRTNLKSNSVPRKSYFYSGPVYRFNDIVKKKWELLSKLIPLILS